jgi:hypothetical protein
VLSLLCVPVAQQNPQYAMRISTYPFGAPAAGRNLVITSTASRFLHIAHRPGHGAHSAMLEELKVTASPGPESLFRRVR